MQKILFISIFTLLFCGNNIMFSSVYADEKDYGLLRAEGAELSTAVGHFTRARNLLLAALREFDKGVKIASPEVLVDIEKWRHSVNDRAEDLKIIIAPQPRITKDGVVYPAEIKIFDNRKN